MLQWSSTIIARLKQSSVRAVFTFNPPALQHCQQRSCWFRRTVLVLRNAGDQCRVIFVVGIWLKRKWESGRRGVAKSLKPC